VTGSDRLDDRAKRLSSVRAYHRATRHDFARYAHGPDGLDWDTQPDPFRRYRGAPLLPLDHAPLDEGPRYADVFGCGSVRPARVDRRSLSRLFEDSLALSAWKQYGDARWALRVDPSSGNLHPTEGYLLCGPIAELSTVPMLAHYAPREHALEVRAEVPRAAWEELARTLPPGSLFVGLTSIHWREAWKYGERAFRYCQHDCGHAIACFAIAAAGLGWRVALCDDLGHGDLMGLLGVGGRREAEPEEPECLLAVIPDREERPGLLLPSSAPVGFARLDLRGEPNDLSTDHVDWNAVDLAAEATQKRRTEGAYATERRVDEPPALLLADDLPLRKIVHQRRSAVAFDGKTEISRAEFYRVLASTLRGPARVLPWAPRVHFGLFVHRVRGLEPGLYALARDPQERPLLQAAMQKPFLWQKPEACPDGLELHLLARGDARTISRAVSCHQDIASDGCFSLGMLAEFDPALERHGAWFYRRLFWECGAVGQVLYVEAEAIGVRATGIGCFFDEPVHEVFGIATQRYRSLYHFTVGGPVDDPRLQSWPAYPPRDEEPAPGHHTDP
jgi:nitroreductase